MQYCQNKNGLSLNRENDPVSCSSPDPKVELAEFAGIHVLLACEGTAAGHLA